MIQKFKNKLAVITSLLVLTISGTAPVAVLAAEPSIQGGVCTGANTLQVPAGATPGDCTQITTDQNNFNDLLTKIINIMSILVGVVAVIMIIIGGFRYITSGGDTTKVAGAKNTILYGLIGLIIVALAQVIVRFVLKSVTDATPG